MRRGLSIVLAVVVALGVAAAIGVSVLGKHTGPGGAITQVRGVTGSEKQAFFDDPEVQRAFRSHGFSVQVDTAGSRQIATTTDLSRYDFAFPAGVPAAEKIKRDRRTNVSYEPFYTPMVVASFTSVADILAGAGVAKKIGSTYILDMPAYLQLVGQNKRWSDLPNNSAYPVGRPILVTSTDVRKSNSAAMYLSIASYVANKNNIVQDQAQADAALPALAPLFLRQGFTESSSSGPFDDYLSIGVGKAPLVMIYEAQFVERAALRDGSIGKDMVLMYPSPTLLSKQTLVPLKPAGDQVGRLLQNDAELQRLAIKHGFRTSNASQFKQFAASHAVQLPEALINVVDPPTYEVLEYMISNIEKKIGG
jgi:hypothetical protein